jgi:hypothetical protein
MRCKSVNWIQVAHDRLELQSFVERLPVGLVLESIIYSSDVK